MSETQTDEKTTGKEAFSFNDVGRSLTAGEVVVEYRTMRTVLDVKRSESDKPPKNFNYAVVFARATRFSGTHSLKFSNPRTKSEQSILRFDTKGANRRPTLIPSTQNAADMPYQKVVFRPMRLEGGPSRSLIDHLRNPDDVSQIVIDAFASAFGDDSLAAVREAALAPASAITFLPAHEFPIVFLPNPNGGDLQATPISPAATYLDFKRNVVEAFYDKTDETRPTLSKKAWSKSTLTSKLQNVSGAVMGQKQRHRFMAYMPIVQNRAQADLWRLASGGRFPSYSPPGLKESASKYANLLLQMETYNDKNMRDALDRRADDLIRVALDFRNEILADLADAHPGAIAKDVPTPGEMILRRRWTEDEKSVANSIRGEHFQKRQRTILSRIADVLIEEEAS